MLRLNLLRVLYNRVYLDKPCAPASPSIHKELVTLDPAVSQDLPRIVIIAITDPFTKRNPVGPEPTTTLTRLRARNRHTRLFV
jgi:hypothetical protein